MSPTNAKQIRQSIEEYFFDALHDWLEQSDTPKAIQRLNQIAQLAQKSGLPQIYDVMIRIILAIEDEEEIRKLIWYLHEHFEESKHNFVAPLHCLQGFLYILLDDMQVAKKSFTSALDSKSLHCPWEAWRGLGIAQYNCGEFDHAVESFKNSIDNKNQPRIGAVYTLIGKTHQRLGDIELAEEAYENARQTKCDPYEREDLRNKLADVHATVPVWQSGVIPFETGTAFGRRIDLFTEKLVSDGLVKKDKEKEIKEQARSLVLEHELAMKSRFHLERFSPRVVNEIVQQSRDLGEEAHRGRQLEELVSRRRQFLTCLKLSMHGFTAHFKYLDPEDQLNFINEFMRRIASRVYNYNGALDRIQTTNIMAYFGFMYEGSKQSVHRQAAIDAVEAAFAIQKELISFFKDIKKHFFELPVEKIKRQQGGYDLKERSLGLAMGISSGWCIFGKKAVGSRNGRLMVGHTVNIAHQLTEVAHPREVLTSQTTYDLTARTLGSRYNFEDITSDIEIEGALRIRRMPDYENRAVYRILPTKSEDGENEL